MAQPTNKSEEVPLLFTVSSNVSYRVSASADASSAGEEKTEIPTTEDSSAHAMLRKRRKCLGAVYEKGDDGQWHLQYQ